MKNYTKRLKPKIELRQRHLHFWSSFYFIIYKSLWHSSLSKLTSLFLTSRVPYSVATVGSTRDQQYHSVHVHVYHHLRKLYFILSIFETLCCISLVDYLGILENTVKEGEKSTWKFLLRNFPSKIEKEKECYQYLSLKNSQFKWKLYSTNGWAIYDLYLPRQWFSPSHWQAGKC